MDNLGRINQSILLREKTVLGRVFFPFRHFFFDSKLFVTFCIGFIKMLIVSGCLNSQKVKRFLRPRLFLFLCPYFCPSLKIFRRHHLHDLTEQTIQDAFKVIALPGTRNCNICRSLGGLTSTFTPTFWNRRNLLWNERHRRKLKAYL